MSNLYADPSYPFYQGSDSFVDDCFSDIKDDRNNPRVPTTGQGAAIFGPPSIERKQISISGSCLAITGGMKRQQQDNDPYESYYHPVTPSASSPPSNNKGSEPRMSCFITTGSFQSFPSPATTTTKSSSAPFIFSPQELDLPLDDDLWLPAEQACEMSMAAIDHASSGANDGSIVERGMLFPWMSDAEIV
jgi:hypothetical protein